jgi:uncharacterized protein (DUF952 family)
VNLYHIATRAAWLAAEEHGAYEPASLASEGFVHCSTATQVLPVAHRFYAGQSGLALLVIDPARLTSTLKWEQVPDEPASAAGAQGSAYPHIYGPVNLDAVTAVLDFEPDRDGRFRAPVEVRREAGTAAG